jgi:hypothetical protein
MHMTTKHGLLAELQVSKLDSQLYGYSVWHGGHVLFEEAGFASVDAALASAAADGADFCGLQVAYQGVAAGTFKPDELLSKSDAVAQLCVENSARFASA